MPVVLTTKNLVANGNGESGPFSSSFSINVPPQDWTVSGSFTSVGYSVGGSSDLNDADSLAAQGGSAYFAGGQGSGLSTAVQHISLKSYGAQINAGALSAVFSGQFGGYSSQDDNMALTVRFFALDGVTVLGENTIQGPNAAERSSFSALVFESLNFGIVPVGTKSMDVILTATRSAGSYNDGYADNISVHLAGVSSGYVLVSESHSFTTDTVQAAGGIVFDSLAPATATFLSSQFNAASISPTGLIEGSTHADTLIIQLDGASFAAGGLKFANWTDVFDTIQFVDGADGRSVIGSSAGDLFTMGGGKDSVNGGAGNDVINGGAGRDVLRGGLGVDDFIISSLTANRDKIMDFAVGEDELVLSVSGFGLSQAAGASLGTAFLSNATGLAAGAEDRIIYNTANGTLYYDADGTGTDSVAVAIALLNGAPLLTVNDFTLIA